MASVIIMHAWRNLICFLIISRPIACRSPKMDEINCVICKKPLDGEIVSLCQKGSDGINRTSAEHYDTIQTLPGQKAHQTCHHVYCHPSNIAKCKKRKVKARKQVVATLWIARLKSTLVLKLIASIVAQTLTLKNKGEGQEMCSE